MGSVEAEYENGVLRRQPDPSRWDLARLAKTSGLEDRELASAGLEEWADSLKGEDGG